MRRLAGEVEETRGNGAAIGGKIKKHRKTILRIVGSHHDHTQAGSKQKHRQDDPQDLGRQMMCSQP